jgi:hypothetical protein
MDLKLSVPEQCHLKQRVKIRTRQVRNDQTVSVLQGLRAHRCADEYYRGYVSRSKTDEAISFAELLIHPSDGIIRKIVS